MLRRWRLDRRRRGGGCRGGRGGRVGRAYAEGGSDPARGDAVLPPGARPQDVVARHGRLHAPDVRAVRRAVAVVLLERQLRIGRRRLVVILVLVVRLDALPLHPIDPRGVRGDDGHVDALARIDRVVVHLDRDGGTESAGRRRGRRRGRGCHGRGRRRRRRHGGGGSWGRRRRRGHGAGAGLERAGHVGARQLGGALDPARRARAVLAEIPAALHVLGEV